MKKIILAAILLTSSLAFSMEEVNDANFYKKVSSSTGIVLVDIYATWCGPCHRIHPILEMLEKEYKGKVKFFQMDTDKNPKTSSYFNVRSIPHILVFKDGGNPQLLESTLNKADLKSEIEDAIKVLEKKK